MENTNCYNCNLIHFVSHASLHPSLFSHFFSLYLPLASFNLYCPLHSSCLHSWPILSICSLILNKTFPPFTSLPSSFILLHLTNLVLFPTTLLPFICQTRHLLSTTVHYALLLPISLLLPHYEEGLATTQQSHDYLLSWQHNGEMSSPLTSVQQKLNMSSVADLKNLSIQNALWHKKWFLRFLGLYTHLLNALL